MGKLIAHIRSRCRIQILTGSTSPLPFLTPVPYLFLTVPYRSLPFSPLPSLTPVLISHLTEYLTEHLTVYLTYIYIVYFFMFNRNGMEVIKERCNIKVFKKP